MQITGVSSEKLNGQIGIFKRLLLREGAISCSIKLGVRGKRGKIVYVNVDHVKPYKGNVKSVDEKVDLIIDIYQNEMYIVSF